MIILFWSNRAFGVITDAHLIIIKAELWCYFAKFFLNFLRYPIQTPLSRNDKCSIVFHQGVVATPHNKCPFWMRHADKLPVFNLGYKWGLAQRIVMVNYSWAVFWDSDNRHGDIVFVIQALWVVSSTKSSVIDPASIINLQEPAMLARVPAITNLFD